MSELPTIRVQALPGKPIEVPSGCTIAGHDSVKIQTISITAPTMEWESGYVRRKLDVALNSSQAARLKSIQLGLEQKEAQLDNGKYVANPVDAIRWLLENAV